MLNRILLVAMGAVIASAPCMGAKMPPAPTSPPLTQQDVRKIHLGRILQLVNIQRRQAGVPALAWSAKLAEIGQIQANDMAARNYFSLGSPEGTGLGELATENNYRWAAIGGNIATGVMSADEVTQSWFKDPADRANMLNPAFTQMGVGYAVNAAGKQLWVQVFGRRSS